ncbi:hypothetical protein BDZ89DRAFT_545434 [Hymenopellis radicata]|nr:hypothetical protein BDZ89DRAFT_545434 [Hymenopellis radicata]
MSISLLIVTLAVASVVNAAIYPTQPVRDTVYTAGQPAVLEWNDDPPSGPMGPFKVELFAGEHTYITTLARNVDPQSGTYTVYLSRDLPYIGNVYTMRMISAKPHKIVYTSNFTIQGIVQTQSSETYSEAQLAFQASSIPSVSSSNSYTLTPATISSSIADVSSATTISEVNSASRRLDLDLNRFVAILWPALVGISMAM